MLAIAAFEGLATFGITLAASILIENLKGYVISPVVEGDQLDIHPLVVFISVLVGSALLGVAGAFVAVPAAAMLQVLYDDVVRPWRLEQLAAADEPLVRARQQERGAHRRECKTSATRATTHTAISVYVQPRRMSKT